MLVCIMRNAYIVFDFDQRVSMQFTFSCNKLQENKGWFETLSSLGQRMIKFPLISPLFLSYFSFSLIIMNYGIDDQSKCLNVTFSPPNFVTCSRSASALKLVASRSKLYQKRVKNSTPSICRKIDVKV